MDALSAARREQGRLQAYAGLKADEDTRNTANDALRQQNALYQQQLAQPVYNDAGAYYNAAPGYWGGFPPHDGHHPGDDKPPRPPAPPVFHPCVPVAGGTVKC